MAGEEMLPPEAAAKVNVICFTALSLAGTSLPSGPEADGCEQARHASITVRAMETAIGERRREIRYEVIFLTSMSLLELLPLNRPEPENYKPTEGLWQVLGEGLGMDKTPARQGFSRLRGHLMKARESSCLCLRCPCWAGMDSETSSDDWLAGRG
jgi:hypothetical protein